LEVIDGKNTQDVKNFGFGQVFEWKGHWAPEAREESNIIIFYRSLFARGLFYKIKTYVQPLVARFMPLNVERDNLA